MWWLRDVPRRQQALRGLEVVQERVYASMVVIAGIIALVAFIITGYAMMSGEGTLSARLFTEWLNGVSTIGCLVFFIAVGGMTYLHLSDD